MTLGPAYGDGGGGGGGGGGPAVLDYIRVSESTTDTQLGGGTGSGTEVIVNFDTEDENTDTDNFSLASEKITVVEAGEYRIEYMLSILLGGDTDPRSIRVGIELDPDTGVFGDLLTTVNFWRDAADGPWSGSGAVQMTLVADSIIQLTIQRNVGVQVTNVDHTRTSMTITKIG